MSEKTFGGRLVSGSVPSNVHPPIPYYNIGIGILCIIIS